MNRKQSLFHSRFYNSGYFTLILIIIFWAALIAELPVLVFPSLLTIFAHRLHVSSNKKMRIEGHL